MATGILVVAAFVAHLLNMQRQQVSNAWNGEERRIHEEELQLDYAYIPPVRKLRTRSCAQEFLNKILLCRKNMRLLKILMRSNLQMSGCGCIVITESGIRNLSVFV
jgi:hypothetical protein